MPTYKQTVRFTRHYEITADDAVDATCQLENLISNAEFSGDVECEGFQEFEDEPITCPDCKGECGTFDDEDNFVPCKKCDGDGEIPFMANARDQLPGTDGVTGAGEERAQATRHDSGGGLAGSLCSQYILKLMTPEQQRIKIAYACGWITERVWDGSVIGKIKGEQGPMDEIPDYPNDLNAMHEAEGVLTGSQWSYYIDTLTDPYSPDWQAAIHAPANQRAEAFLKTLGIWEDNNSANRADHGPRSNSESK